MADALAVSQVLLWIIVAVLAALVLALARQVGILHERIAPVGALALSKGPSVGDAAPLVAAQSLTGRLARIGEGDGDGDGRSTLLFFLSPRCPVCKTLLPTIKRLVQREGVALVLASDGEEESHREFAREHGLALDAYFVSTELGLRYQIAKLPYAVLIDSHGIVRAQGIVNTREHVESLFEAQRLRVASLQDYLSETTPESAATAAATWEEEARA